jgi:hypothetical protein
MGKTRPTISYLNRFRSDSTGLLSDALATSEAAVCERRSARTVAAVWNPLTCRKPDDDADVDGSDDNNDEAAANDGLRVGEAANGDEDDTRTAKGDDDGEDPRRLFTPSSAGSGERAGFAGAGSLPSFSAITGYSSLPRVAFLTSFLCSEQGHFPPNMKKRYMFPHENHRLQM